MKKISFLLILNSFILLTTTYAKDIKSVVIVKPEINYDENIKYEKTEEFMREEKKAYKEKYDFGFDLNINKEERTIDYWKVDVKTNF
jgi:divalent metal cation (Fe/Co/Zn/Cd) transporter